jgi:hypothetical protein
MRAAGEKFLPKEPKESEKAYKNRLARTTLYNVFGKACGALNGKLFSKPLLIDDKVSPEITILLEDVDGLHGKGRDVNRFMSTVTFDALAAGVTHVLVDMPALPKDIDGNPIPLTLADAKTLNLRPKWLHYKAEDVVSWRQDSQNKLQQLVLRETILYPDGEWAEKTIEQYRVLTPGTWRVYRKPDGNALTSWVQVDNGITALDFIPLVSLFTAARATLLTADRPLLEDLAFLNIAHWQSSSDQRNILHVSRVPILFGSGWEDQQEDGSAPVEIGPNRLILQPTGADLKFVEHTGAAIKSGEDDLQKIEAQMQVMAMEPVMQRSGSQTATARALDTAEAAAALQDIAQELKDTVEQLLVCTGAWLKIPPQQCGEVTIYADFSLNMGEVTAMQELGKARLAGDISREAYLNEFKRRDYLSSDYDAAEDKELLDQEAPSMTTTPTQSGGE